MNTMLLMIDNYDSFTYNLVQYFGELDQQVEVFRNDEITVDKIEALRPKHLVISPGPCTPNEAGVSVDAIRHFAGKVPILGVCLGHQCIAEVFGGTVVQAPHQLHGKTSFIHHDNKSIFQNLPNPFLATRYHSLIVERETLPDCLEIIATTRPLLKLADARKVQGASGAQQSSVYEILEGASTGATQQFSVAVEFRKKSTLEGEIMGLRHRTLPIWGVQFHPESILTTHGKEILKNFLK
jgi:anthranilate synthase/aminodeoxychorismate synthase-like glutamine amidotransferase